MTDITIPPESLEAGTEVCRDYRRANVKSHVMARACFLAMVKAWPGIWTGPMELGEGNMLILPLTEKPDDKA